MNDTDPTTLSNAGKLNVAAILAFAAVILVQVAGGVDYPTIPPGAVISVAVVLVLLLGARWRWTTVFGAVWPLFLCIGMVQAEETADRLGAPGDVFVFSTSVLQAAVLVVALVSGVAAVVVAFTTRKKVAAR